MSETDSDIDQRALSWLVKTNDPEFDAWEEFTDWLERDVRHADAYHRKADAYQQVMPMVDQVLRSPATSAPDDRVAEVQASPVLRRVRGGLAVAALASMALTGVLIQRAWPVTYNTGRGEMRTIVLGGQDRLVMNGSTKVTIAGLSRRSIMLKTGEILLQLTEDAAAPVEVAAGDLRLVDVGTIFSVARTVDRTRVTVAEGEVIADPAGAKLHLPGGMRLDVRDGQKTLRSVPADPQSVGAWRSGQLAYAEEPLTNVLIDLSRASGLTFRANPSVQAKTFTGTLSIIAVKKDPKSLSRLLGVPIEHSQGAWALGEPQS